MPRPHLGAAIEDGHGKVIQEIRKPARRHVKIDQRYLDVIMQGLLGATTDPKGTSADVFKGFPLKVYGKTGTAERPRPGRPVVVRGLRAATRRARSSSS